MEQLKIIGYYICETVDLPQYLAGISTQLLSVSNCLGELHPKWEYLFDERHKGKTSEYQKRLQLGDEQYRALVKTARGLFQQGKLSIDCRFLQKSDAQHFYKQFCPAVACRIVSVSTTPIYFKLLAEELKRSGNLEMLSGRPDNSAPLGCDILGWDIPGFHSFLCNSLHQCLPKAEFNEVGLLKNDFSEVAAFARRIEGMGEPVAWIPCKIGEA